MKIKQRRRRDIPLFGKADYIGEVNGPYYPEVHISIGPTDLDGDTYLIETVVFDIACDTFWGAFKEAEEIIASGYIETLKSNINSIYNQTAISG